MVRATRIFALTVVLVVTLGVAGAGAQEAPPGSRIDTMNVTAGTSSITVAGKGVFTAPGGVVGTDASGDGGIPGSDMLEASITQLTHTQLRFDLKVGDLPPVVGGTPEILNYNWPLDVVKGSATSAVSLQAWRTSTGADLLCGVVFACPGQEPGGNPRFTVNTCAPDPTTGNNTCTSVGVTGEFTADGLAWIVPQAAINAGGGAILYPSTAISASYGGSGLTWNTAGTGGDTMTWEPFTVEPATVKIGIATADTAEEDVPLTVTIPVTASNGNYTGALPRPGAGSYRITAQACLGAASCGTASRLIDLN